MIDQNREATIRHAIELMFFGYRRFTDQPDRILDRRGLSRVHHRILYFVGRTPGITVKGLLGVLSVTKQALNAPLRQLLEMNLVTVLADQGDRRLRRLTLTQEGRRLEAELTGVQTRQLAAAFEAVGLDGEASWMRVMEALAAD
jgi:DNA-binding MarR family transcriptional regulator